MSKQSTLTEGEKDAVYTHDQVEGMRGATSRDTKNRAFLYWLAQHILGKSSSHMKAEEMKAGLNKHHDAIRAAKQPLPTAGQAKGVAVEALGADYIHLLILLLL